MPALGGTTAVGEAVVPAAGLTVTAHHLPGLDSIDSRYVDDDDRFFRKAFGLRLRLLRTARGFTQDNVAERAGLTRNFISAAERGRQPAELARVRRLAYALNVSLPALVDAVIEPAALAIPPGSGQPLAADRAPTPEPRSAPPIVDLAPLGSPATGSTAAVPVPGLTREVSRQFDSGQP